MTFVFDPASGLVRVEAEIVGPRAKVNVLLALDTGASQTLLRTMILVSIGCDPGTSSNRIQVITASGVEYSPLVPVPSLRALGRTRSPFIVIGHTFPPGSSIDGLLGIDFLRESKLTIDFRNGTIGLES